jgi:hypothetical protein
MCTVRNAVRLQWNDQSIHAAGRSESKLDDREAICGDGLLREQRGAVVVLEGEGNRRAIVLDWPRVVILRRSARRLAHRRGCLAALAGVRLIDDNGEGLAALGGDFVENEGELLHRGDDDFLRLLNELAQVAGALGVTHRRAHLHELLHNSESNRSNQRACPLTPISARTFIPWAARLR